ncbi:hypothetical protein KUW14_16615 [Pseudooceanicola nitratireducens]|uniref:hypothetical protein n=1 Tax=Pseudooceanicola nitratireducens TaxID=517719 RepID=UPI001C97FE75|nr:hypothetical protein [Pseudooceanicola nitratireducens]MBY6167477.1 hypothetical protein [Pseudooceanicola nitratireducens]MEC7794876.1 hypothetical protein [Pseudomonadota bacterium]
MRVAVYMLSAAAAVSVPGIVANQLGWRIGDLSMFAQEEAEPLPPEAAPQLVSYETADEEEDAAAAETPIDEEFLPRQVTLGGSFVALPDPTLTAMRDKLVAMRGGTTDSKKSGGH